MPNSRVLLEASIDTPEQMHELGVSLAKTFQAGDLILLIGPLGAGKTTLARGIGEGMKVEGNVSSPTFVIARTHKSHSGPSLVHVDAYRLKSAYELDELDIPFTSSVVLVEWGKGLTEEITDDWLEIEIARDSSGQTEQRKVSITAFGSRWDGVNL